MQPCICQESISYISFCIVVIVDSKASFSAGCTCWVSGVKSGPDVLLLMFNSTTAFVLNWVVAD